MIVSKFGGSITASAEKLRQAIEIIKSNPDRRYVIASAPGQIADRAGITDMLFMCYSSFKNHEDYTEMLQGISRRYQEIIDGLEINFDIKSEIEALSRDLLLRKNLDYIGSRGEYILGKILAESLGWDFVDASEIIFFNDDETLNELKTFRAANEKLSRLEHAVIPGFYGTMPNGNIKTFPRGDGDSSGAIVACALKADLFEKWSETAKTFSADPSVIDDPVLIKNITYDEAIELNYIGINTIKDSVIFMLKDSGIPLKICSLHDENENGMLISAVLPEKNSRGTAICIAGRKSFKLINIEKYGLNKIYGFGEKLFGLFAKYHIACEHCLSGIYKMSIVLKTPMFELRRNEFFDDIRRIIEPDSLTIDEDIALIAIIGQGSFEKIFSSLSRAGINVRVIDQGSDDLNIIIGVSDKDYVNAVRALYDGVIKNVPPHT